MENPSDRKFELIAPGIVQLNRQTGRVLFVFEFNEEGRVKGVRAYKKNIVSGRTMGGFYSENDKTSTFVSLCKVLTSLREGTEMPKLDGDWVCNSLVFDQILQESFEKIAEKFCR